MTRDELINRAYDIATSDMELTLEYTDGELWEGLQELTIPQLIEYIADSYDSI